MSEALVWENPSPWPNLSNSDNSAGHGDHHHHRHHHQVLKSDRKHMGSSSDKEEPPPPPGKKRGRVVLSRNGKGIICVGGGGDQVMKEGKVAGESDHEMHIWTERERRKKMRNMFANLHALLPQLPPKADKSTIVDEAVNYIKNLQQTLQKLQKQKLEKLQSATTATTFNHEPTTTTMTPQRLGYDHQSREAFLADQGSCTDLATTIIDIPSASASLISTTSHSPVMFQTWTSSNVVLNICGEEAHISVCSPKKPGLFSTICYILEKHKISIVSAHISSDTNRIMYMIQAHAGGGSDQLVDTFPAEEIFKVAVGEIMFWVSSS